MHAMHAETTWNRDGAGATHLLVAPRPAKGSELAAAYRSSDQHRILDRVKMPTSALQRRGSRGGWELRYREDMLGRITEGHRAQWSSKKAEGTCMDTGGTPRRART